MFTSYGLSTITLVLWASRWGNHGIAIATNNAAIMAWINNGSFHSSQAMAILRKIFWNLAEYYIQLWAKDPLATKFRIGCRVKIPL
jgi:hypothetical protein